MTGPYRPPSLAPERVDPARLTLLLERNGWRLVGGRRGEYNRLVPPATVAMVARRSIIVPLDRQAPDYEHLMGAALVDLADTEMRDQWVEIAPRLAAEPTDAFKFRKESSAPAGLISWRQGEDLIAAARSTLVAGAKAHLARSRRYSNRFGQFAGRYLDAVLMGQTAVGSYIVTAFAPAHSPISISGSRPVDPVLPGTDNVDSRLITESISTALGAAAEGLQHYRNTGSFAGFEDGVGRGFSYDLAVALQGVTLDSDGGDIRIDWEPSDLPVETVMTSVFEFKGSDSAVLEKAANRLAVAEEGAQYLTEVGRVHLLTKKHAGGPGVFGLETLKPGTRKLRVRLVDPEQYHIAVQAHDEDLAIRVSGNLERDGMIYWLYDATIRGVVGPLAILESDVQATAITGDVDTAQLPFEDDPDSG